MPEPFDRPDPDDDAELPATDSSAHRAEAAFRQALHGDPRLGEDNPVEGGPDLVAVRRRARNRSWAQTGGAIAAMVAVAAVLVSVADRHEIVGRIPIADNTSVAPTTDSAEPLPLRDGWRYEYYRDIRIQVPADWGYDTEPGPDWCASVPGGFLPRSSYVARRGPDRFNFAIACPEGGPPLDSWVPHVTLSPIESTEEASAAPTGSWSIDRRTVGSAKVTVVTQDHALAEEIARTAAVVDGSESGCDPTSPIYTMGSLTQPTPAFDLAAVDDIDDITVCQYENGVPGPGLLATREMTGQAADAELAALQAAPLGTGPDLASCANVPAGESSIVLHLHAGEATYTMAVYYASCPGNGFYDGTAARQLTPEACGALFEQPIAFYSGYRGRPC